MPHRLPRAALLALVVLLLAPSLAVAAGVQALFDLAAPATSPFPSDRFTVADASHNTGLRVDLAKPDCAARPSDCADLDVINTLDGFNIQPRLSIPFSGPIDVATVSSATVFLVRLGDALPGGPAAGKVVGINQVVWDPATNTLHAESDELLEQHTRYVLVVTGGVRDTAGDPVEAGAFATFRHDLNFGQTHDSASKAYRKALIDALDLLEGAGVSPASVVTASVFTTQSVTAVLEKVRDQIKATTPAAADFLLGNGGTVATVFPRASILGILFNQQRSTVNPLTPTIVAAFAALNAAVGTVAFGKYASPDYETSARFIPPVGTRTGVPAVQATSDVYFNLFVPAGPPPANGWPVAIFGHGFGDNKNNSPFIVASTMAANGIATIAINVVGHGRGPLGTLVVNTSTGPVLLSAGGRGIDQNGDTVIDSTEGSSAAAPRGIIGSRDGLRQTVIDLMQLTRLIETGGIPGLDPARVYYFGQSFGGIYGTIFLGVEPSVRLGVPNVPGGPIVDITLLSPVFRGLLALALGARTPSLLNGGGPGSFGFTDSLPLRDQPPVTAPAAGAMPIQRVVDDTEWVQQAGNPVAYGPHLRKAPLAGMPAKHVIVQFAKGDQTVPNPTTTGILRAGDLADRATYFRNDLAFAAVAGIPKNPHTFLTSIIGPPAGIAIAAQLQIAAFFASEVVPGLTPVVIDPDTLGLFPVPVFEVPIVPPLPETLNFIP